MRLLPYLKSKFHLLLLYLLILGLLGGSFALYQLPMEAVEYPMVLVAGAMAVYLVLDYRRERRQFLRIRLLEEKIRQLEQSLMDMEYRQQEAMDYFNVWAHQIKTPIAAMGLELQSEDTRLSRRLKANLDRIESYAQMVLTYLRLGASSTDYVFREQDLDEIVRATVRKFSGEFIARKLALHYEPLNTRVLTDEKWLSFVLEQVLSNALKYTPSGSISIYLESPKTLCIRDTGMGIAPEDLPRIFDQGFTGYNGRTDKKATGIGLYLCKRICRELGHPITARSQIGEGTTIRIDLNKEEF